MLRLPWAVTQTFLSVFSERLSYYLASDLSTSRRIIRREAPNKLHRTQASLQPAKSMRTFHQMIVEARRTEAASLQRMDHSFGHLFLLGTSRGVQLLMALGSGENRVQVLVYNKQSGYDCHDCQPAVSTAGKTFPAQEAAS